MTYSEHPWHAGFVLLYLFLLIAVGARKARKVKSQEDFALAGRGLGTGVLIGTLLATWIGTGSIFGNAEKTYGIGLGGFLIPIGGSIGIFVLVILSQRIRRFGQFTIQDILEARFGVAARVIGTITLVLAYVIIVSYQYRSGATILMYLWPEMSEPTAKCVVALFVIAYTALAGMYSVAYTDVANGILMAGGILMALVILFGEVGGAAGVRESLPANLLDPLDSYTVFTFASYVLPTFLLVVGDANMYQRFFSATSPESARKSAVGMLVGVLFMEAAIIAVALFGRTLVEQGALSAPENPGHIVVHLAFEALPTWLGAAMIATVVAIVVSTADSYLLSPASSVVRDVWQRFFRPASEAASGVLAGRVVVFVLGLIALGLSFASQGFFDIALFAYTIYGAGITPAVLAAFFWPRATRAGATASMLTGAGTSILWYVGVDRGHLLAWAEDAGFGGLAEWARNAAEAGVDAVLPAILVSLVVLVVVSLLGKAPDEAHREAI